MSKFAKFYVAFTTAALAWGASVVKSAPTSITAAEWIAGAGVLVTAIAVWFVPNGA